MIIQSILDNDLYSFTQQQAILRKYPNIPVTYEFTNRRKADKFSNEFLNRFKQEVKDLQGVHLKEEEYSWLRSECPYLSRMYLDYLKEFRFNPDQVSANVVDGDFKLTISAPSWEEGIMWELPLMAIISETYFSIYDTEHPFEPGMWGRQQDQFYRKGQILSGIPFIEFGTRRRRSRLHQDLAVKCLMGVDGFMGTSNVHLAMKFGVKPRGTMAHQWIMGVSALEGLQHANRHALYKWSEVYHGDLGIALTDTYGANAFWGDFDQYLAKLFDGVRHDSDDPFAFAERTIAQYKKLKINPLSKMIVFSDSLTPELARELWERFNGQIGMSFGIGTNFTNSVDGRAALNMVIKLRTCNGMPVVKLSDVPSKATGDRDAVRVAMWTFFGKALDD
jgi:nicotinate phosphoribosyltransferase